jgi:glycerol-3-phosphate dehydrogenase
MNPPTVILIGAGSTGSALAHDLALRGLGVLVIERAGIASGTTGHNQAQLHSGARYAVVDPGSARECIAENKILRQIMPEVLELNEGLFVAVSAAGLDYSPRFMEACQDCGIPAQEVPVEQALRWEPLLSPQILAVVQIPDGVFEPYRFCLSFLATAQSNGAEVFTFNEVIGIDANRCQARVYNRQTGKTQTFAADAIVNAAGPWASKVAHLAGLQVEVEPSAGVMVTVDKRVCNHVLNRLAPPADGDIIVPQRNSSILGTTSWSVTDPDSISIPPGHAEQIFSVAEQMVPGIRKFPIRGVMAAARPLLKMEGAGGRATPRGFACYQHSAEGAPGFFSVVGGKTTTARLMAEKVSDQVVAYLHWERPCKTSTTPLLSYRKWSAHPVSR